MDVHLVWLPMNEKLMRLCWEVILTSHARSEMFLLVVDAQTGEVVHQRKLPLEGTVYSSVTLAGGRLYFTSEAGTTVILTCGREPKQIARNRLERLRSSPVFAEKRLYLRTLGRLYCIGQP